MKRAFLPILLLLGVIFSAKGFAAPPMAHPLYAYYNNYPYSPVYSIDFASSSINPLWTAKTGGPYIELVWPGCTGKDLIYSRAFSHQTLYVIDANAQAVDNYFDLDNAPHALLQKGICWAFHGDRAFFFGNRKKDAMVFIYDGRQNQLSTVMLDCPMVDAATDRNGNLFIATSTGKLQRFNMDSMTLVQEMRFDRELLGVFRLGEDIVVIDENEDKESRWTRMNSDMELKEQKEFGLLSNMTWHPRSELLFIRQKPYSPTGRTAATLIVLDAAGERHFNVPQVYYLGDHFDRLEYPFLYTWGAQNVSVIDLRTGKVRTLQNLEGDLAACEFFPSDGGGSGVFFTMQLVTAGVFVDFGLNASMRLPVGRALAVYFPQHKWVAVYRSALGELQLIGFPNGETLQSFKVGKGWRSVMPARDGRCVLMEGKQGWRLVDTVSHDMKLILPPPNVESWNELFYDTGYIEEPHKSSAIVFRQDGVYTFELPAWNMDLAIPYNWKIRYTRSIGEIRLVERTSISL